MKKNLIALLLILLSFLLQTSVLPYLSIGQIMPNLLIILVASYGFMFGQTNGLLIGFACGLLADIFCNDILGFYALLYAVLGYLNGSFQSIFYPEDIKLPLILISASDLIYGFVCYVLLFLLRNRLDIGFYFWNIILPELVYTLVLALLVYPLLLAANKSFLMPRRKDEE